MKLLNLITVIDNPTESIFYALQSHEVPWKNDNINTELDLDYLYNRSGNKITSNLVDFFIDSDTGKIESLSMEMLANIIYTKYGLKWAKEYATLSAEYDPISNYDMTERMTNDQTTKQYGHTNTRTDNLAHSETDNLSRTDNLNETTENKKAGFNSSDYVAVDKSIKDNTGTQSNNRSISGSNTGTQANVESGIDTETRNYLLTRKGNIGVTTSQQMLESERKLWLWDFFDTVVFPDIDKVLTIQTYN